MKTVKIIDEQVFTDIVEDIDLVWLGGEEYEIQLELTKEGMEVCFSESWKHGDGRVFTITGEFSEDDFNDMGFQIIADPAA